MKNETIRKIAAGILAAAMIFVPATVQPGVIEANAVELYPDAVELGDNMPISDVLQNNKSIRYKYTVTQPGTFFISITSEKSLYATIYDSDGNEIEVLSSVNKNYNSHKYSKKIGTVFYIVLKNYTNNNNYTITAEQTSTEDYEIEPNDSASEANEIQSGQKIYGVIGTEGVYTGSSEADNFVFTAPTDGKLKVYLTNEDLNQNSRWNLDVNGKNYTTEKKAMQVSSDEIFIKEGDTCRIKVTGVVNSYSIGRKYGLLADFTELSDNEIIDAIQSSQCRLQSTKSTKKSITAAWNEAEISGTNVDGYQISIKKKGTSTWKSSTVTGTKKEFSSLKSKTKYLLRVRPYASVNVTRYYGKWSVIKTVKTK